MKTVEVSTKVDFEKAVKNNAERIIVTGDLAKEMIAAQKKKAVGKVVGTAGGVGLLATIAGIALAPVTAGASVAAASALTIGGGTVAMTTAEVAIAATTILGVAGIAAATINTVAKNYDMIKVNKEPPSIEFIKKKGEA